MCNRQCMMSYAQGSSVGTTSTSVRECRKETTDRLAVCTAERTVTHRLPLTQGGRTTSTAEPQQPQGRSRTTWTGHRDHKGGGELPTQHDATEAGRTASTTGPQQPQAPQLGGGGMGGGLGVATLDHMYEYMCVSSNYGHAEHDDTMGT